MAPKRILQVAFDVNVLKTREIILTRDGHHVSSVAGKEALELRLEDLKGYDLVLIGRDAPLHERRKIARYLKQVYPDCKIVALHAQLQSARVEHADLNAPGDDPNDWLQAIRSLLSKS
jgi:DNA-binding NtrC family response regulator